MATYTFPGFTRFLESAAREIDRPEAAAPARRIATLSALANLCAQAGSAGRVEAATILDKAAEFRDQLHAAHRAADLMIEEVGRAVGIDPSPRRRARSERTRGRVAPPTPFDPNHPPRSEPDE